MKGNTFVLTYYVIPRWN